MIRLGKEQKETSLAIGVDLGGTFIKAGIIDNKGNILKYSKIESFAEKGPQAVTGQIQKVVEQIRQNTKERIKGIGIGSPGIVSEGKVKYPPNFKNWKIVPLQDIINKSTGLKTKVNNDAKCAALAELKFGYGKKIKNFLFLTLGTGIGGAIIINGEMYTGEQNGAGEFGMVSICFNGTECLGGNPGAIEAYLGRKYFLENEKKEIKKLGKNIDFEQVTKLASKNNKTARELFKKYGFYLGVALTNYFNLMDMRNCILGGGISNAYPYFIKKCNKTIEERALKTIVNEFKVLRSEINNEAGILGAAALILN